MTFDGHTYPHSRIAYVKGRPAAPVVIVHHNYAGLKQFDVDQACFLARAGYVGLAVDLYKEKDGYVYADRNVTQDDGEEKKHAHFRGAFDYMIELLRNPKHWRGLMAAYLEAAFAHPSVAKGMAGAIGYCLGGQSCFEQLRGGHQLQVIVSFHGLLHSRPTYKDEPYNSLRRITVEEYHKEVDVPPTTCTPGCRVVVENGGWDAEVPPESIGAWMAEMDGGGVDWRFNFHARTPHGWALAPGVTGGADNYREVADRRSTLSMLAAFAETWPSVGQHHVEQNACGTPLPPPPRAAGAAAASWGRLPSAAAVAVTSAALAALVPQLRASVGI